MKTDADPLARLSHDQLESLVANLERQLQLREQASQYQGRELEDLRREVAALRMDRAEDERGLCATDACHLLRSELQDLETMLSDSGFSSTHGIKASLLDALLHIEAYRRHATHPLWKKSRGYA